MRNKVFTHLQQTLPNFRHVIYDVLPSGRYYWPLSHCTVSTNQKKISSRAFSLIKINTENDSGNIYDLIVTTLHHTYKLAIFHFCAILFL